MSYATRTCEKCGVRKPQNEMIKTTKSVNSASVNPNRSKSARIYSRNKTVFYCKDCGKPVSFGSILFLLIVVGFIYMMVAG